MSQHTLQHVGVATYDSGAGAVEGVRALLRGGLDINRLSVAGRDVTNSDAAIGFYTSGTHTKYWGAQTDSWNALANELCEAGLFFIPKMGPLVVLGPLVGCCVAALESIQGTARVGLMEAALTRIGIPSTHAARLDGSLSAGRVVVVVLGGASMIEHARSILPLTRPVELDAYSP